METNTNPMPIACSLRSAELKTRRERWLDLASHLDAIDTTARGLRLRFAAAPGVATELEELAVLERDCCAFADWSVAARADEVVLDVTGIGDEAIPSVQAMFGELRRAASQA
jgi:hypothetical protein